MHLNIQFPVKRLDSFVVVLFIQQKSAANADKNQVDIREKVSEKERENERFPTNKRRNVQLIHTKETTPVKSIKYDCMNFRHNALVDDAKTDDLQDSSQQQQPQNQYIGIVVMVVVVGDRACASVKKEGKQEHCERRVQSAGSVGRVAAAQSAIG